MNGLLGATPGNKSLASKIRHYAALCILDALPSHAFTSTCLASELKTASQAPHSDIMEYYESGSEEEIERRDVHIAREPGSQIVSTEPRPPTAHIEIRQHARPREPVRPVIHEVNPGRSRRTQPIEPTARIEQFYGIKHTTDGGPAHKLRSKHVRRVEPKLTIEGLGRKAGRSGKSRPHELRISSTEKPGFEPGVSYVEERGNKKRRPSRHYALASGPGTSENHGLDQNANEMLDDYYDGFDDTLLPHTTTMGLNHEYGDGHAAIYELPPLPPETFLYPEAVPMSFHPPPPGPPPRPPRPTAGHADSPSPERPQRIYSRPLGRPGKRYDYIMRAPYKTAIWDRAAVWNTTEEKYELQLRLVLTRHGERYSSDNFPYRSGTWTDIVFARKLNEQYRSLKTAKVGIVQKLTAYKKISFVYFIQFHAFPDVRYPSTGAWLRTDRKPITFRDNPMTRNSFMNQLQRLCMKRSVFYSTLTGKPREVDERPQIRWVSRLEDLIEAGAVIDIDVKETFDSAKIYMGLFVAIAISLGAGLGYGFAMDNDFSTGFSIASWVITALGFFAAVIAAGEYLGLDSPKATLMDADGRERPWY